MSALKLCNRFKGVDTQVIKQVLTHSQNHEVCINVGEQDISLICAQDTDEVLGELGV